MIERSCSKRSGTLWEKALSSGPYITINFMGEVATTVAVRLWVSSTPISPITSPAARAAVFTSSWKTSAVPSTTTKSSYASRPCSISLVPLATSISSACSAMLLRSGATLHQAGEIELRAGRLEEAAEKFREANEHGFTPLPGLAKLRLRQGRFTDARDLMSDAFKPDALTLLDRARLLPTWSDIHVALDTTAEVEAALSELERAADICGSVAMTSAACLRRGRLALAAGDTDRAVSIFESAIKGWTELKMPYEAAESHLLPAEARHASGNNAAAELELDSARSIFERLGAEGNVERVEAMLAG